nr:PspC domain-containing protein [Actinomycetales bacterium]
MRPVRPAPCHDRIVTTSPELGRVAPEPGRVAPPPGMAYRGPELAEVPDGGARPPLVRPSEGRVLLGVCAGVGTHLGLSPWYLRAAALVALPFGVVAYVFLALAVPSEDPDDARPRGVRFGRAVTVTLGLLLLLPFLLPALSPVFESLVVVSSLLVLGGIALGWSARDGGSHAVLRIAGGGLLALSGALLGISAFSGPVRITTGQALGVALVTLAVLAVLLLPLFRDLFGDLAGEREARIRESVRADIAAHLHDSVLQSLTLIRANASDPAEVARLARAQERSLRSWLYEDRPEAGTSLAAEVRDAAAHVEDRHGAVIEVVAVGDSAPDERTSALVGAVGEALTNAVKHGEGPISVYLEVGANRVEAFVRDRGAGFDPAGIPAGRHGVRDSIIGRMERVGGEATVRSPLPSGGTEVRLVLPVERSAGGAQ